MPFRPNAHTFSDVFVFFPLTDFGIHDRPLNERHVVALLEFFKQLQASTDWLTPI